MKIIVILIAKWRLKSWPNYVWIEDQRLYNTTTKRFLKKTMKGAVAGYWIGKKFLRLAELKNELEKIPTKR